MNIFCIDRCPVVAARHLVDTHCVKMVLESAQMLANCFTHEQLASAGCPRTQAGTVRKYSHYNHPCSKWVRVSRENMRWLYSHAVAMDMERITRTMMRVNEHQTLREEGKEYNEDIVDISPVPHFCMPFIHWVLANINESIVPEGPLTEFAQAMPDEYKCEDSVHAYRNFYKTGKAHLHVWTRNKPTWI